MNVRFKRGDAHPDKPGLFFWGYAGKGSKPPVWVSSERLAEMRVAQMNLVRRWQSSNPEKVKAARKFQHSKNKVREAQQLREWKIKNPARWKELKRNWEINNPEKYQAMVDRRSAKRRAITAAKRATKIAIQNAIPVKPKRVRLTAIQIRDKQRAYNRAAYWRNAGLRKIENKLWRTKNAERVRNQKRAYKKHRLATDPVFKLKATMRRRLSLFLSLNQYVKEQSTFQMIGCTPEFLKAHLEALFHPGMSWENKHLWQIDHIIPLKRATNKEQVLELFHYTNLQPLWNKDNLNKGAKMPPLIAVA